MPEEGFTTVDELKAFLKEEALRPVRRNAPQLPHLRLRQLEVFREAARHDTFSDAARSLRVTRAAVSDTIQQLEQNLGSDVHLFETATTGTRLTDAGRSILKVAEQLLNDEEAARTVFGASKIQSGAPHPRVRGAEAHLKLRQIELFVEAARHENLREAAKSLGVSTSYMSEAISDLERELGEHVFLFERDTGGSTLTQAGKLLAARGEQLLQEEAAVRNATAHAGRDVGEDSQAAPVSARHRGNAEHALAALEFIEHRASPGREVKFPTVLTDELKHTLPGYGHISAVVERMALVLDLMQASVTDAEHLGTLLHPEGRASNTFRSLHQAAEQERGEEASPMPRQRGPRSR